MSTPQNLREATGALQRMQQFDTGTLARLGLQVMGVEVFNVILCAR